uniref:BTB domain-containing protein n=1 Tax=Gongylonema pulchrum TaxID=637853 RepID=A0A183DB02_9BILA
LVSKCDRHLMARSRSDEIPICDLLIQRFVDKGIIFSCLARFDRQLAVNAPELCGRVHLFFVSAPVFHALKTGEIAALLFLLHERAVFDFLKQKRMIAEMLQSSVIPEARSSAWFSSEVVNSSFPQLT